jgi:hypothetical protein
MRETLTPRQGTPLLGPAAMGVLIVHNIPETA